MKRSSFVCVRASGWYTGGCPEYVALELGTWWGSVYLVGWRSRGDLG